MVDKQVFLCLHIDDYTTRTLPFYATKITITTKEAAPMITTTAAMIIRYQEQHQLLFE